MATQAGDPELTSFDIFVLALSVLSIINMALAIAPLGPLVAGLLLESTSARAAIAVFAAAGLALALWGTLSGSIRGAPSLSKLAELPAR